MYEGSKISTYNFINRVISCLVNTMRTLNLCVNTVYLIKGIAMKHANNWIEYNKIACV